MRCNVLMWKMCTCVFEAEHLIRNTEWIRQTICLYLCVLCVCMCAAYISREIYWESVSYNPSVHIKARKIRAVYETITRLLPFKNKTVKWQCNLCACVWRVKITESVYNTPSVIYKCMHTILMQAHKSIWMQQKNERWLTDDDNGQGEWWEERNVNRSYTYNPSGYLCI